MRLFIMSVVALVLLLVAAGLYLFKTDSGFKLISPVLAKLITPAFPELPEPLQTLNVDTQGVLYFPSYTAYDLDVVLAGLKPEHESVGMGTLLLPADASAALPAPLMIIVHGSGGIADGREFNYGQWMTEAGYAVFIIDYYASRGIKPEDDYMKKVVTVTEYDIIADSYSALKYLRSHPSIDGTKTGMMGFSYGGMASRLAMDKRLKQAFIGDAPGFSMHGDLYGPCFQQLNTQAITAGALITLRGDADASNNLQYCLDREAEMSALGATVQAHVLPNAGHAWENSTPRDFHPEYPYVDGCIVEYDEKGHSSVEGRALVNAPIDTTRVQRIALRMQSADVMQKCLKYGYILGRDEVNHTRSNKLLLNFMHTHMPLNGTAHKPSETEKDNNQ